jgi:hypothetical protein
VCKFRLRDSAAREIFQFHDILSSSIEAGDSRIDTRGTIYIRPDISLENIIKQCIIPRGELRVRIYVIFNKSSKGKMNSDN